jgi:TolB-like protein
VPKEITIQMASQPIPLWVITHKDSRYPDQQFLAGVGESASSFADAEAQARTDLAKRIEVQIEGQDRFVAMETTDAGFRYSVKSEISEAVAVRLSGLTTADRWIDSSGKRFYALTVLSRERAMAAVRMDLDLLLDDARTMLAKAKELEAKQDPLRALMPYGQLQALIGDIQALRKRYFVLRGDLPDVRPLPAIPSVVEIDQRMDDLLASIHLVRVSGDGQRAVIGRPLDRPLTVRVVTREGTTEHPMQDLPIVFTFEQGQGQVDRTARCDQTGQALATVREVRVSGEAASIVAKLDVEALAAGWPPHVRRRASEKLSQQVVVFQVVPPRGMQAGGDPWMQAVWRLGETLLSRFDFDEKGRPSLAVLDFVETYGSQRLPLSQRLETGLRTALAQWDFVNVVQRDVPASAVKPEDKARALGVEHYVDGVYALSNDTVTVNASLRKVSDGTTKAAGYVAIPRDVLTPQDLQGFLDRSNPTPSGIATLPSEAPLTYDQLLARLVMLRQGNPPFLLRLWADQGSYAIGEKVTLYVQADRDCYLTLVDIGTSGNLTVLFPNAYEKNNRIQAGRRYEIPGPSYGFDIHVAGPSGVERVKAIATTQPFTLFEHMDLSDGFFGINRQGPETMREVKVSARQVAPTQWTDASIEILVLDRGKSEPRGRGLVEQAKSRALK